MRALLLDTNAYANYLRGDTRVLGALAGAGVVYVSIFVLGELFTGFRQEAMEKTNRQNLEAFLGKPVTGKLIYNESNEIVFSFGKHKGERVVDNADYCGWVLGADFPEATKAIIRQLVNIKQ